MSSDIQNYSNNTISKLKINDVTYDIMDAKTRGTVLTLDDRIDALINKTTPTMKTPGSSTSGQSFRISSGVTETPAPDICLISLGNLRIMYAVNLTFTSTVAQNAVRNIVVLPESDCPYKTAYAHAILTDTFIGGPYILISTSSSKIVSLQNKTTNSTPYPKGNTVSFTAIWHVSS